MNPEELNFFQHQFLTFFRRKNAKGRAEVYHWVIRFVMKNNYNPSIRDLIKSINKTAAHHAQSLKKSGLLLIEKRGEDFFLTPILKPFAANKYVKEKTYTLVTGDQSYDRAEKLRKAVYKIIKNTYDSRRTDWKTAFKEAGCSDYKEDTPPKPALRNIPELEDDIDDSADSNSVVVVSD